MHMSVYLSPVHLVITLCRCDIGILLQDSSTNSAACLRDH